MSPVRGALIPILMVLDWAQRGAEKTKPIKRNDTRTHKLFLIAISSFHGREPLRRQVRNRRNLSNLRQIKMLHDPPRQKNADSLKLLTQLVPVINRFYEIRRGKFDGLVKSSQSRHSREGGSPEVLEKTGFPPEFTPAKAEAGMTENDIFSFLRYSILD